MLLTILLFIIILGLLVFIHELGHFLTARFFGVKADEFGFGFPPRAIGAVYDDATKKYRIVKGSEQVTSPHTVYSLNWLPLGGFVAIKGENGNTIDPDSFSAQAAWKRVLILAAGVIMNFVLAIVLFAVVFTLGIERPIDAAEAGQYKDAKIQIVEVRAGSAAESMGLTIGDTIQKVDKNPVQSVEEIQQAIHAEAGQEVILTVSRLGEERLLKGTVPVEGTIGIALTHTATVKSGLFEAISQGAKTTVAVTLAILGAFGTLIAGLFTGAGAPSGMDLTGPVGIVYITKQMSDLGLVYILQFAALLSVNLAIINALPIPALDGGRILFVIIEKLKGSPIKRSTEGMIHQIGFLLLMFLMVFITTRDVLKFELLQKLVGLFS
jgi:regulator of sigma E protease